MDKDVQIAHKNNPLPPSYEYSKCGGDKVRHELSESEISSILVNKAWLFYFNNDALEQEYRNQYRRSAIKALRFNGTLSSFLFIFIGALILRLIPTDSVYDWILYDVSAFFIVSIFWGLVWLSAFERWFDWYVSIGGIIAIATSVFVNNSIPLGNGTTLSYTALTYIVLFIYCFIGLRVQIALFTGITGGILGVSLTYIVGADVKWDIFNGTFGIASILALFLAYGIDRQTRVNFLQSYLLHLNVKQSKNLLEASEAMVSKLDELSNRDALTGLANRRYLDEIFLHEWHRALHNQHSLVVMMIDIDYFKGYNDTMGHLAGDECLRKVASLISNVTHRRGEFSARYGGEEFILLYQNLDMMSVEMQAQKLYADLTDANIIYPTVECGRVTFSMGISVCIPSAEMSAVQLIQQADSALYKAKANGRNRYEVFKESSCS